MKDSGLHYKKILYLFSIGACMITSLLLILAIISLITNWFFLIENNWLILIFKLHAGYENVQMNSLELFNLLDALIMFLIFVVSLALYDSLSKNNNIEKGVSLIALVLPLLGLIVFFFTGYAGRASVFVWGILFSMLMLKYEIYHKITGLVGIVSNSLLFFSDIIFTLDH